MSEAYKQTVTRETVEQMIRRQSFAYAMLNQVPVKYASIEVRFKYASIEVV